MRSRSRLRRLARAASAAAAVAALLLPPTGCGNGGEPGRADGNTGVSIARPHPFPGSGRLLHDVTTDLGWASREAILRLRFERVAQQRRLALFPSDYRPDPAIFGAISSGVAWQPGVSYYIANPYLPVVVTRANHATPLAWSCPEVEISYQDGRVEEIHRGANAACWLDAVFSSPDLPGQVRLVTINAQDAGFPFAHVDRSRSVNLAPVDDPRSIVNASRRSPSFFHVGRYRRNNISPADPLARATLVGSASPTTIYIALWRNEPRSSRTPPDLVQVVTITP